MPRFHHANLGVPPGIAEAEGDFLVDILGYRRMELSPESETFGARWYEADDGTQIHLSVDPEHRPGALAHTAIEVGDDAAQIEARLEAASMDFRVAMLDGVRILICHDPAGNRWELRS